MAEIVYHPDGRIALQARSRPPLASYLPLALPGFAAIDLIERCHLCDGWGTAPDGDGPCPRCDGWTSQPTKAGEAILDLIRRHYNGLPFA